MGLGSGVPAILRKGSHYFYAFERISQVKVDRGFPSLQHLFVVYVNLGLKPTKRVEYIEA